MIKVQYEFDNSQEREVRELIDRAKWKQIVTQLSAHLIKQENDPTIPECQQMVYHRLRKKMLEFVHISGLSL